MKMDKPIDPTTHAALDYGLSAMQILGPDIIGLPSRASAVSKLLGAFYGATTAMTDTPLGIKPVISFPLHGAVEVPFVTAMLGLPWLTGACKGTKARLFFLSCAAMAVTNFMMTDFNAREETDETYGLEDVKAAASEAIRPLMPA
jgi:hypothetical protein